MNNGDVTYYLFTNGDQQNFIQVNKLNAHLHFEENAEIVFLIHGWISNRHNTWYEELKNAYFSRNDKLYNVIEVDWSGPASSLMFPNTAIDARIVGNSFILHRLY